MHTETIWAELELAGTWDRDVEVLITSDVQVTSRNATPIIRALYPNHIITAIEVRSHDLTTDGPGKPGSSPR